MLPSPSQPTVGLPLLAAAEEKALLVVSVYLANIFIDMCYVGWVGYRVLYLFCLSAIVLFVPLKRKVYE